MLVDTLMAIGVAGVGGTGVAVVAIGQERAAAFCRRAVLTGGCDAIRWSAVVLRDLRRFAHLGVLAASRHR